MTDGSAEPDMRVVGEAAPAHVVWFDHVAYANVFGGLFVLTLTSNQWTAKLDGTGALPDPGVSARLRFGREAAKNLHDALGKMLAADSEAERTKN